MIQKNLLHIENGSSENLTVNIEYISYQAELEPGEELKIEVEAQPEVGLLSLFDLKYLPASIIVYINNNISLSELYKVNIFKNAALILTINL